MPRRHILCRFGFSLLFAAIAVIAQAAVIRSAEMTVQQPDGSTLKLFATGDEYHNWLHDADNFTIIPDKETGFYCYATRDGEGVTASPLIVGKGDPRSIGLEPGINISGSLYRQMRSEKFYMPAERDAPTTGTINNLVIYIRFSDETEFGQSNSIYDGWFNTGASSQKGYFLEASYNQLTVNTHFYPAPSGGYVVSWQDSNPRSYYQPYNASTNPNGYDGDTERRNREFNLLQNACNAVGPSVPSGLTIDSDNDGRVDNVVFIVKGSAGAWSSLLWPHRWSLYDRYVYIQGKRVYDFNFQLQNFLSSRGVGVICHEFFHTLGAPDLYHYTDNGIDPAGSWDLMESDQNPPQHMTAFMKWKYGDWIASIPTISADGVYSLNPLTSATGQAYRINSNNANQYYMVEFRKKTGTYESSIPNSGMLIYRIDTSCGNGNADGPPDELYIYRLNGTTTVNGTLSSAHFSTESGRIKIDNTTNPAPFLQDGSAGNLYLCEIGSSSGTTMTFRKGAPQIDFGINPYTQGFDASSYPPDGWLNPVLVGSDVFTRVTTGGNPSCNPQSGAGMLKYNSDSSASGSSALLVSPKIVCTDAVNSRYSLSFWMYRDGNYQSSLDKVEFYINTSASLSGSPTLLGTIHRNRNLSPAVGTPGWKNYSFELPMPSTGNYYVIAKAISAGGYNMYLDSFSISRVPAPATNPIPVDLSTGQNPSTNLSWTASTGSPAGYKLYLGTDNPPTNLVNGTDLGLVTTYNPSTDLLPLTTYYWQLVPYNSGGLTPNCPIWSFSTPGAVSLPLTESFGTTGTTFPPLDWIRYSGVLANPSALVTNTSLWTQDDWLNLATSPANKSARMNIYGTRYGWMISPLINIPAGSVLEFDLGLTDYNNSNPISSDPTGLTGSDDSFAVLIGDGTSWSPANIIRLWDNNSSAYVYNQISHLGQRVILDLSAYAGYKYIAFYGASSTSNADNDLFVDNISLHYANQAPEIAISPQSWDAGPIEINTTGSQVITFYNTGLSPLVINSISLSGDDAFSLSGVPTLPAVLSLGQSRSFTVNLNPHTAGVKTGTITINDNRALTTISLNGTCIDPRISGLTYTEEFDAVVSPAFPIGWTTYSATTSTGYVRTATSGFASFPNSVTFYNSSDLIADLRLISPQVLIPLNGTRLSFKAKGSSAGFLLLVGTMPNPTGAFTQLASFTLGSDFARYELNINYSGTDSYLVFKHGLGDTTNRTLYLDDIMLEGLYNTELMALDLSGPAYGQTTELLSYTASVKNNGLITQNSYTVRLMLADSRTELTSISIDQPLTPGESRQHILSWMPQSTGDYELYCLVDIPGDSYTPNNQSPTYSSTVFDATNLISAVGSDQDALTGNQLPLDFFYKNSISETIYLPSDLQMTSGLISHIGYVNSFVQNLSAMPVKIWMKNSSSTDLSLGWEDFAGYSLVFDGTVSFPQGVNNILIALNSPFTYTGGNLAVRVNRPMDAVYYNTANHFYYNVSSLTPNRSRYLYSDSTVYDPTAPSASGTLSNNVPMTVFVAANASPFTLEAPQTTISEAGGILQLSWSQAPGHYGYQIFETDDPTIWPVSPTSTVYTPSFSAPAASRKFFKIKAFSYSFDPRSFVQSSPLPLSSRLLETIGESPNKD